MYVGVRRSSEMHWVGVIPPDGHTKLSPFSQCSTTGGAKTGMFCPVFMM